MNRPMQRTHLKLRVPDLGLEKGEAVGFHLVGTSKATGQTTGGIAVIVTGCGAGGRGRGERMTAEFLRLHPQTSRAQVAPI